VQSGVPWSLNYDFSVNVTTLPPWERSDQVSVGLGAFALIHSAPHPTAPLLLV
jgi:hypothetical protein